MIVLSCGTEVVLSNSEARGIITAIKIIEHNVCYEVSYFVSGVLTRNWFSQNEFEVQGVKRCKRIGFYSGYIPTEKGEVSVDEDGVTGKDWIDRGAAVILSMAHGRGYRDFVKGAMNEWGFKTKESLAKLDDYEKDILTQYLEE